MSPVATPQNKEWKFAVNSFKVQINALNHIFNLSIGKFGLAN
jgi:hypothetical protein